MKSFWWIASVVVVFLMGLVLDPFEINWGGIELGTAPEWICAFALIAIAVGVWRIALRVIARTTTTSRSADSGS